MEAISWKNGVPVSDRFDDPYYSLDSGADETRHVFLDGNDLPARFRPGFHIAELGFGTGLNALVAAGAWRDAGISGPLAYTSFEAYPLSAGALGDALAAFPRLADLAEPLIAAWRRGETRIETKELSLTVVIGDARQTVPVWTGAADAWFLDGFAPARNPELWEPELLQAVARHTTPDGTAATYSAAGAVRRALTEAGFAVERRPGYGRKRHMVAARLTP